VILDTSALAAILFGEPEADRYTRLIHGADRCLISAGSFLELSIVIERQCDMFFRRAGILVEPFTVEQAHIARRRSTISEKGVTGRGSISATALPMRSARLPASRSCSRVSTSRKPTSSPRYDEHSSQKCQMDPQLEHFASVAASLLERPVARTDTPAVKSATVAFAPLMPFLSFTWQVVTDPFVWQCGETSCAFCSALIEVLPDFATAQITIAKITRAVISMSMSFLRV
jgi:hypothetical protein